MSDRGLKGVKLSDEQRLDWLQLIRSENIGPRTFRELINRYGGARGAIDALPDFGQAWRRRQVSGSCRAKTPNASSPPSMCAAPAWSHSASRTTRPGCKRSTTRRRC